MEIKHTHIYIKTIFKKRKYIAEFKISNSGFEIETTVGGNSIQECIEKSGKFLKKELTEKDYTVI